MNTPEPVQYRQTPGPRFRQFTPSPTHFKILSLESLDEVFTMGSNTSEEKSGVYDFLLPLQPRPPFRTTGPVVSPGEWRVRPQDPRPSDLSFPFLVLLEHSEELDEDIEDGVGDGCWNDPCLSVRSSKLDNRSFPTVVC